VDDINIALSINPVMAQGYIYRGMYLLKLNKKDSACYDFAVANKMNHPLANDYRRKYCK
jgi:lipoprotein NlpI